MATAEENIEAIEDIVVHVRNKVEIDTENGLANQTPEAKGANSQASFVTIEISDMDTSPVDGEGDILIPAAQFQKKMGEPNPVVIDDPINIDRI